MFSVWFNLNSLKWLPLLASSHLSCTWFCTDLKTQDGWKQHVGFLPGMISHLCISLRQSRWSGGHGYLLMLIQVLECPPALPAWKTALQLLIRQATSLTHYLFLTTLHCPINDLHSVEHRPIIGLWSLCIEYCDAMESILKITVGMLWHYDEYPLYSPKVDFVWQLKYRNKVLGDSFNYFSFYIPKTEHPFSSPENIWNPG